MLEEVSKDRWISTIKGSKRYSIFVDPSFLEPIAQVFNYSLNYYLKTEKGKPVLGFACFVKGKAIKVPTHFIYSGIWWDLKYETIKFRDVLIDSIVELKSKYNFIEFRLPPDFVDIRPFQWLGFSYQINYTYTRNTSQLDFEYNVRSRVKKAIDKGIVSNCSTSFSSVWSHQIFDLKRFYFSNRLLKKVELLFNEWWKKDFMLIFDSMMDDRIVGSSCVLYDKHQSTAYNLLISSANSNYNTGVHASLYNFIFNYLQKENISNFDLYGADLKGVANFKASFDADLKVHYTVRYNKRSALINKLKTDIKTKLIAIKSNLI